MIRPDPSGAKVTISPAGSVRAGPFGMRVVPDIRIGAAEEGLRAGMAETVRVREPAARTRGELEGGERAVVVVVGGMELREESMGLSSPPASGTVLLVGDVTVSCRDVGALASCACPFADRRLLMVASGRET